MNYDNVLINLHITEHLYVISKKVWGGSYKLFVRYLMNKIKMKDMVWVMKILNPIISDLSYKYGFTDKISIEYIIHCISSGFCIKNIEISINMVKSFGKCFSN